MGEYTEITTGTRAVLIIISVVVIFLTGVVLWMIADDRKYRLASIYDFSSCETAGGKVQESDPRRCVTADGRTFTEKKQPDPAASSVATDERLSKMIEYVSSKGVKIYLDAPAKNDVVMSPLTIKGEVPGSWSYEADFPILLTDMNGELVARTSAKLLGNWMTEYYVPFEATLTFDEPQAETESYGMLVLQRSNASGAPERNDTVEIPVRFN